MKKKYDSYSVFIAKKSVPSDFSKWLAEQNKRNDPVGDLAEDARADQNAPWHGGIADWQSYLYTKASNDAKKAFREAVKEFEQYAGRG